MEAAAERLTKASHKLAEVMYQQQAGGGAGPAGGPVPVPAAAGSRRRREPRDEVIDAEYVEK